VCIHVLNSDKINLNLGKIPPSILKSVIFNNNSKNLFIGPGIGLDFSAVKIDKKYLITSSDPVTGIKKNIGIYVVNLCANDIAVSGNSPNFFQSIILLPKNSDTALLESIVNDINYATSKLGIEITGGHTEVTNIVDQPLVIGTAFSVVDKFVSNKNIREGDMILMTKTAGIEGTLIIENMFDTSNNTSKSYKKQLMSNLSIIKEATEAFNTGYVNGMHDPTEGGILGGIYEMSEACNIGFKLYLNKIPVSIKTKNICKKYDIDPLKLISSGSLLIAVNPLGVKIICDKLSKSGISTNCIGEFSGKKRIIIHENNDCEELNYEPVDELWKISSNEL